MTQRFDGYIHSIIGHQIMVSPNGSPSEQYKCALDDFESIMPTTNAGQPFTFHVKRDKIGVEHYRQWLGLTKIEKDRLANLEQGMLDLVAFVRPAAPAAVPEFAEFFKSEVQG
jgi:hypothetical protein